MEDKKLYEKIGELIAKAKNFSEKSDKYYIDISIDFYFKKLTLMIRLKEGFKIIESLEVEYIDLHAINRCSELIDVFESEETKRIIEELARSDEYIASIKDRIKTAEILKKDILQITLEKDEEDMVEIIDVGIDLGSGNDYYKAEKIPQRGEK